MPGNCSFNFANVYGNDTHEELTPDDISKLTVPKACFEPPTICDGGEEIETEVYIFHPVRWSPNPTTFEAHYCSVVIFVLWCVGKPIWFVQRRRSWFAWRYGFHLFWCSVRSHRRRYVCSTSPVCAPCVQRRWHLVWFCPSSINVDAYQWVSKYKLQVWSGWGDYAECNR